MQLISCQMVPLIQRPGKVHYLRLVNKVDMEFNVAPDHEVQVFVHVNLGRLSLLPLDL